MGQAARARYRGASGRVGRSGNRNDHADCCRRSLGRSRAAPLDRLPQLGAFPRSLRDPDLPDRRDRARGGVRALLWRVADPVDRRLHGLRPVRAAIRLARRQVEPAQHDRAVLLRHGHLLRAGRRVGQLRDAGDRAVRRRRVRRDLSPGRHADGGRCRGDARPHDGVQRHLRQYRRLDRERLHRGDRLHARLALHVLHSGGRVCPVRLRVSEIRARHRPPRRAGAGPGRGAEQVAHHRGGDPVPDPRLLGRAGVQRARPSCCRSWSSSASPPTSR